MDRVPIIDVTKENITQLWSSIIFAIKSSSYIALDLELSGIGDRKKLMAKCLDDRYIEMVDVAKTRAILSVGISCYSLRNNEINDARVKKFMVQTYNLLILCSENYIVEPDSLKFLVGHGFDFNRQYSTGLPYHRGRDQDKNEELISVRSLFSEIVKSRHPIVLHNGFVDLLFLYQNLYTELPGTLNTFVADLTEIFLGGIYDTKFFSEFKARIPASYLEYVFRKQQRSNVKNQNQGRDFIHLQFPNYPKTIDVEYRDCSFCTQSKPIENSAICKNYRNFGWCSKGKNCNLSHDIDDILDVEEATNKKKRKIEEITPTEDKEVVSELDVNQGPNQKIPGGHRAGFDAFMTGFAFATFWLKFQNEPNILDMPEEKNKIFLCGKDHPLLIMKSQFSKMSSGHKEKIEKLMHFVK